MKTALLSIFLSVFVCEIQAQTIRTQPARLAKAPVSVKDLPIKRVILYSNGVAYFERRGRVTGRAEINLSFKHSQMDDVLKSLVVLDLGSGRIGAVSYNSSTPAAARMSEIPFAIAPATNGGTGGGLAGVLSQLQGARVVVNIGTRAVIGSIITVEARQSQLDASKPPATGHRLVIATETGELSGFDLSEVRSVKLADNDTRRDVNEFAIAAASARRRDAKSIVVTSDGDGERELVVSYTIAAPIWKTTYRVVLDRTGQPFFQGWAIVDNVSEEDWLGVQLSLVSGTPISFIQPIQNPVFRYRPVVPLSDRLNLTPQVHGAGIGDGSGYQSRLTGVVTDPAGAVVPNANVVITDTRTNASVEVTTDSAGAYRTNLLPGTYTLSATAPGFTRTQMSDFRVGPTERASFDITLEPGAITEAVTVISESSRRSNSLNFIADGLVSNSSVGQATLSNLVSGSVSDVRVVTTATDLGDLFEYRIDQPVTVRRDRSALIPILQTRMEGERISIYNESTGTNRPLGGLILRNTSKLTLEDGSLTVLDGDSYAGEALMQRLKPGEERLISFALDLGTLVTVRNEENRTPTFLVKVVDGVVRAHYHDVRRKIYTFVNQTDRSRTIYLEHPIDDDDDDWELTADMPKPESRTEDHYRFRLTLAPNQTLEFPVTERQELWESYTLTNLTRREVELFISRRYIDDQTRAALEHILELKSRLAATQARLQLFDKEVAEISQDQQRLRENIKALTQGTLTSLAESRQLIARYLAKANDQETRLEEIGKQRSAAIGERENLQREVDASIRSFQFERKIALLDKQTPE